MYALHYHKWLRKVQVVGIDGSVDRLTWLGKSFFPVPTPIPSHASTVGSLRGVPR